MLRLIVRAQLSKEDHKARALLPSTTKVDLTRKIVTAMKPSTRRFSISWNSFKVVSRVVVLTPVLRGFDSDFAHKVLISFHLSPLNSAHTICGNRHI